MNKTQEIIQESTLDTRLNGATSTKFATASKTELEKLIQDSKNSKINYNALTGASINPKLSEDMITDIFRLLADVGKSEQDNKTISKATKIKNVDARRAIRNFLTEHPNIPEKYLDSAIKITNITAILKNPKLTDKHLQMYYDIQVNPKKNGSYNIYALGSLIDAKSVNARLLLIWYNDLLPFADWKYNDDRWQHAIYYFTKIPLCPVEILKDVAAAPPDGRELWRTGAEKLREISVEHRNSTPEIKSLAFKATGGDLKYLPVVAQEIFIF